jgi:flagellar basal body rod protein FlgG
MSNKIKNMRNNIFSLALILVFGLSICAKTPVVSTITPELEADERKYAVRMENVVNMQTPGYRELKSTTIIDAPGKRRTIFYRDFKQGPLVRTKQSLDLAIEGSGFFVIQTPFGLAYTRDGRFVLDSQGQLVTRADAYPVLGMEGPIFLPDIAVAISQDGNIYHDDKLIGRLRVAVILNPRDLYTGNGVVFSAHPNSALEFSPEEPYKIRQGYVENSNVNSVEQLGNMASDQSYDLKAKILQMELSRLTKVSEMLR